MTTSLSLLLLRRGAVFAFCPTFTRTRGLQRTLLSSRRFLSSTTTTTSVDDDATAAAAAEDEAAAALLQAETLEHLKSPFLQVMRDRGFLHQCTGLEQLDAQLCNDDGVCSAYLGFDATADSLHVGSLLQIMILRHLQQTGHRPVVLLGGATSKVGDPTGKDASRVLLTEDIIQANIDGIAQVFETFLQFQQNDNDTTNNNPTDAVLVNNDDWLSEIKYLDFLRDYGRHFTINRMLSFESVKQRLTREAPFSFLEFNYMILQAYDFLELNRRYKVILQLGGSDQWGNMVAGTELGRKVDGVQLFALTAPLITTSDGKKMGKTANGAVWLRADRCSVYDYWQFWRNTADDDVIRFLKLFTELDLAEIDKLAELEGAALNQAKIVLADEATALLHGRESLESVHKTIETMFSGAGVSTEGLERVFVTRSDLEGDGVRLLDLFVQLQLASSKKEARRLIQGGGAKLGDDKVDDENASLTIADFGDLQELTLRAGKKRAGVVEIKE